MEKWYEDHYLRIEYEASTQELSFINVEDKHASTGIEGNELIRTFARWLLNVTEQDANDDH